MARRYGQRECERTRWMPFHYILNINDVGISIKRDISSKDEINAASNTTIVLARMVRKGRMDIGKRRTP